MDILQIEPTRNCNLNCKSCVRDSSHSGDIDLNLYDQLLDKYSNEGFDILKLQGLGEPFMHPEIDKMVKLGHDYGYEHVMTITNGTRRIHGDFDHIMVSINSVGNQMALTNLAIAKNDGYNVSINCVLVDQSKNEISKLNEIAEKLNINVNYVPMEVWYGVSNVKHDEVKSEALKVYEKFNLKFVLRDPICEWSETSLYFDYLGRQHACCIRMTDEYIIDDWYTFNWNDCCKECPL